MTLFQCRRFQFFDLEKVDLDISIKEHLKGSLVRCGSGGRGYILVGDSEGALHSISRQFETRTIAHAHHKGIHQIYQLKGSHYVVTLGEDEPGLYSIKVWDEGPLEQDSNKTQIVLKKVIRFSRPQPPTCFAVHESLTLLAVGFEDGEIQFYRGELTRERNIRARILLHEGDQGPITGLCFKTHNNLVYLFAAAKSAVIPFDVTTKDKEMKFPDDKAGCEKNCCCYSDGTSDDHFIVGRSDAIYCYSQEGRGPCFGFDGEKHMLYFFRGYLLIIALLPQDDTYNLTIFDYANKFVAFGSSLRSPEPIKVAVSEWGSLFLLTEEGTFWQLREKDLQTKMSVFYKKNHYDLAVRVAKSNNFDSEGMSDIFRQYGDHLYNKGDLDGAIRQYTKTVGILVPSYVVRKYLEASRVRNLLEYLEVIHKLGYATPDLTNLLLNCLTKLKENEKIEHYVKDPSCDFLEPATAIQVFRKGGMSKQAYQLALRHKLYGSALQILLEDVRDPCKDDLYEVLEKVVEDENVEDILRRYGSSLIQLLGGSDPKATDVCKRIVNLLCKSAVKRDLVDIFIPTKDILIPLLEDIAQEFTVDDGPLMNLLLEAYLDEWVKQKDNNLPTREKILALLSKAPDCTTWDWPRALLACRMSQFHAGEIIAYEKLGLHNDLLEIRYKAALTNPNLWAQFLDTCKKYAKTKPSLWKDAFFIVTTPHNDADPLSSSRATCPPEITQEILGYLFQENLMEPLPILERLCQTRLTLATARDFLIKILDRQDIEEDKQESKRLMTETDEVRKRIWEIRTKPTPFQSIRCNACSQKLELPSVHFLCLHSFHQHCFDSYAANDKDCPVCWLKQKDMMGAEMAERKLSKAAIDADFTQKLSNARSNSFAILADFFTKGLFRDENPSKEPSEPKRSVQKLRIPTEQAFDTSLQGKVTEGRLRLHEGVGSIGESYHARSSDPASAPIESFIERARPKPSNLGQTTTGTSFEARRSPATQPKLGTNLPFPRVQTSGTVPQQPKKADSAFPRHSKQPTANLGAMSISSAVAQGSKKQEEPKNPFDDEEDPNNPFLDPAEAKVKNPFEEEGDYDPSLNPFAE